MLRSLSRPLSLAAGAHARAAPSLSRVAVRCMHTAGFAGSRALPLSWLPMAGLFALAFGAGGSVVLCHKTASVFDLSTLGMLCVRRGRSGGHACSDAFKFAALRLLHAAADRI